MSKNMKTIVAVVVFAGLAAAAFIVYKKGSDKSKVDYNSKESLARYLVDKGAASNYNTLLTFDLPFLQAWVKDHIAGASLFSYNAKTYNTKGGTAA